MNSLHTLFQEMGTVDDLELFAEKGNYRITFTRNQTNYQIDDSTMNGLIERLNEYLKPEEGSGDLTLAYITADIINTGCSFVASKNPHTGDVIWTRTKKVLNKG